MRTLMQWIRSIRSSEINLILWFAMLGAIFTGAGQRELIAFAVVGIIFAALVEHVTYPRRLDSGSETPRIPQS